MQIWAVNAAKSTICDMLSKTMVNTAVPPGMEAGFAQLVMAAAAPPPEGKDKCVVQFMDESEGGGEPRATAVQLSLERTPHQSGELCRTRLQDSDSHAHQEALTLYHSGCVHLMVLQQSVLLYPSMLLTQYKKSSEVFYLNKLSYFC